MPKKRKTENELKLSDDVLDCLHADIEKIIEQNDIKKSETITFYELCEVWLKDGVNR
jgi:hypothetical protein